MAVAIAKKTFPTHVNLPEENRQKLHDLLNLHLANALNLKTQVKHAHWNVKGAHFYQLHLLFDSVASHLEEHGDLIAERITALGGVANGTLLQAAAATTLAPYDLDAVTGDEHLHALTERVGQYANGIRKAIDSSNNLGDQGTADIFTEVSREIDKDLWFIEAHLQG